MSGGAIERVVRRVWGHGRQAAEDTTDHRAQLLELCTLVQHATAVWGPGTDDNLYRYALEHLKPMARATLLHAEAARVRRTAAGELETNVEPPH